MVTFWFLCVGGLVTGGAGRNIRREASFNLEICTFVPIVMSLKQQTIDSWSSLGRAWP